MVPGEQGSVVPQGCRLQELRELNLAWGYLGNVQGANSHYFTETFFAWGYPMYLPPFPCWSISLEVRKPLLWGHWQKVVVTQYASNVPGVNLRAFGRVMHSSDDKSTELEYITTLKRNPGLTGRSGANSQKVLPKPILLTLAIRELEI